MRVWQASSHVIWMQQEEKINKKRQEKEPQHITELVPDKTGPENFLYDRVRILGDWVGGGGYEIRGG
jgi:lipase chaperone LimK